MLRLFFFFVIFASVTVEARVFNYKDASLAAFIRGTGGTSGVNQDPFANSSGVDTSVSGKISYAYSGELGAVIGLGDSMNLRIGAEGIQHHPLKEAKGSSPTDVERFTMESSVFVFNPNLTLEFFAAHSGSLRYYGSVGVGYAMIDVENRYTMSPTNDLSVNTDFNEKMYATSTSYQVAAGLETLFVDNVTFAADVGYRYLKAASLKYRGDVNNFVAAPGTALKDAEVLNHDGSARSLDLSGFFVGVAFRFYLHFL